MEKRLKDWLNRGLISEEKYNELLSDLIEKNKIRLNKNMQIVMYTIGALFVGTGIILSLISSDLFQRLASFLVNIYGFMADIISIECMEIISIFILTLSFLFCGHKLACINCKTESLGKALIFLSTLSFGGLIALIGRICDLGADTWWLYFIWFLGVYPLALIYKSRIINTLSIILALVSINCVFIDYINEHSLSFLLCAVIFYVAANLPVVLKKYTNFSFDYKLLSLFILYIVFLANIFNDGYGIDFEYFYKSIIPFAVLFVLNFISYFMNKEKTKLLDIETIFIGAVCLFAPILFINSSIFIQILSNIFIIFMIGAIYYTGYRFEKTRLINSANVFTVFYLISLIIRFLENHLQGILFFLAGGIILIVLAIFLETIKKKYPIKK